MEASFFTRHPHLKDFLGVIVFIICVGIGTVLINAFVFRSYHVVGPSMEATMFTGDRLIVDRVAVTWANVRGESYLPQRGQIIVFRNPNFTAGLDDEYLVKRVIGLPGERVTIQDGHYIVYNQQNPNGFNPDDDFNNEPGSPTSGQADVVVPANEVFVSGDHRQGNFSFDSRNGANGLGTVPSYDIIGPVSFRIFPFNTARTF